MPDIRPISDLRSRFAEISRLAHQSGEPVFLTKNGYGDLVVLSVEAYQNLLNQIKMQNTPPRWKFRKKWLAPIIKPAPDFQKIWKVRGCFFVRPGGSRFGTPSPTCVGPGRLVERIVGWSALRSGRR